MRARVILLAAAWAALCASAAAQDAMPSQYRGLVFLGAIAERGPECGRLRPWEAAALEVQSADAAHTWTDAQRAQMEIDASAQAHAMGCDDEAMNVWIDGARRGIESEMLAHFIVIYAALSEMDPHIALFRDATQLEHHAPARAAITEKLAELEAAGAVPEGGAPWPQFIARTSSAASEIARGYENGDLPARYTPAQIEALITGSVRVTELWLAEAAR